MLGIYSEGKCKPRFVKSSTLNGSLDLTHFLGVQHSCIAVTWGRVNRTWIGKTIRRCWHMCSLFPSQRWSRCPSRRGWGQGGSYQRSAVFICTVLACWSPLPLWGVRGTCGLRRKFSHCSIIFCVIKGVGFIISCFTVATSVDTLLFWIFAFKHILETGGWWSATCQKGFSEGYSGSCDRVMYQGFLRPS